MNDNKDTAPRTGKHTTFNMAGNFHQVIYAEQNPPRFCPYCKKAMVGTHECVERLKAEVYRHRH